MKNNVANRLKKNTVFSLIIKNYIIFTILIFITIVGVIIGAVVFFFNTNNAAKVMDSADYLNELEAGKYENIPIKKLAGNDAGFFILNDKNKVVYKSEKASFKKFSLNEVKYISQYYSVSNVSKTYSKKYDKNIWIVTANDADDVFYESEYSSNITIVDEDLNILYSSSDIKSDKLTQNEFNLLLDKKIDGKRYRVVDFTKNDKNYKMVINFTDKKKIRLWNIVTPIRLAALLFVLIYGILLLIFAFWLNRKVTRPITNVNNALIKYENTGEYDSIEYKGISELENISNSYNGLFRALEDEEKYRKQMEKERQDFVAGMTHDLKTPITGIKGYVDAISNGLVPKEDIDKYLTILSTKIDRLDSLINALFQYNQLENNEVVFKKENVDICEIFRNFIIDRYDEFSVKNIDIDIDIPDTKIYVDIDVNQMSRVFENLINNSIKHNEKNISLYFGIKESENYVRIYLGDNGKGISEKDKMRIFEPYYRSDTAYNKGSGLGLAVCDKIVAMHGGTIELSSKFNNEYTTVFEIMLDKIKL